MTLAAGMATQGDRLLQHLLTFYKELMTKLFMMWFTKSSSNFLFDRMV
jgi:hypothetical protein